MYPAGATTAGAGAAAAAIVQAVKASGALVRVEPDQFQRVLNEAEAKVVVVARGRRTHRYAVGHGGFVFWTKTKEEPMLPPGALVVDTKRFWMPA